MITTERKKYFTATSARSHGFTPLSRILSLDLAFRSINFRKAFSPVNFRFNTDDVAFSQLFKTRL